MSTKLKTLYAYLVLTIAYAAGTLIFAPTKQTLQKYHLTIQHLRVIDITVIILFAAIWFCAAYAFYNFRQYYHVIQKTKEGKPLDHITKGIGFLAFWFPITGVFGLYTNEFMMKHVNLTGPIVVTQNYLSLLIPLLGFLFISVGARKLTEIVKQRPTMLGTNVLVIILISFGATYIYLLTGSHSQKGNAYHLSNINLLVTMAIPYIYMWFIGLLSAYEIFLYRVKAPGIIYRQSWQLLALGTTSLIALSITLQYLTTITEQLNKLSLDRALIVIYALLILLAISYVLVALGVRNLKKIEEV